MLMKPENELTQGTQMLFALCCSEPYTQARRSRSALISDCAGLRDPCRETGRLYGDVIAVGRCPSSKCEGVNLPSEVGSDVLMMSTSNSAFLRV